MENKGSAGFCRTAVVTAMCSGAVIISQQFWFHTLLTFGSCVLGSPASFCSLYLSLTPFVFVDLETTQSEYQINQNCSRLISTLCRSRTTRMIDVNLQRGHKHKGGWILQRGALRGAVKSSLRRRQSGFDKRFTRICSCSDSENPRALQLHLQDLRTWICCILFVLPCTPTRFHVPACEVCVRLPCLFRWICSAARLLAESTAHWSPIKPSGAAGTACKRLCFETTCHHTSGDYGALLSRALSPRLRLRAAATTPSVKRYINEVHISTRSRR